MQIHEFLDDDLRDSAALFVLDSMEPDDARAYRLHVLQCNVCRREVESLARSARDLALLAPVEQPSPQLFGRVLERIRGGDATRPVLSRGVSNQGSVTTKAAERVEASEGNPAQVWKAWSDSGGIDRAGFLFVGGAEGGFEPTGFEGIEARRLFVDHDNDRVTMLVRMRAGARYPGHVHASAEECYVVSGDLHVGDRRMHAGDFQRAEPGSLHPVQSTENGCVLLLTSSLHDELT
jgi:quercetin dioxygenase-like cupin family protein